MATSTMIVNVLTEDFFAGDDAFTQQFVWSNMSFAAPTATEGKDNLALLTWAVDEDKVDELLIELALLEYVPMYKVITFPKWNGMMADAR